MARIGARFPSECFKALERNQFGIQHSRSWLWGLVVQDLRFRGMRRSRSCIVDLHWPALQSLKHLGERRHCKEVWR